MSKGKSVPEYLAVLMISLLILSLASCEMTSIESQTGSISLTLEQQLTTAKTLLPGLNMTPTSYMITGTGPSEASFNQEVTSTSVTIADLAVGAWTITVQAYNNDATPTLIGSGSGTVTVTAGETANSSITVAPLTGNGTLSINLTWPTGVISVPAVVATLTPLSGIAQSLNFTLASTSASYSSSEIAAGYYTLAISLNDGNLNVGGKTEIVRIISGQTTNGVYNFTTVNEVPLGGVNLTITPELADPLVVSITGGQSTITVGSTLNLTASVANSSGTITYAWYVNGVNQNVNTANWTGGSTWATGFYQIDVTAINENGGIAGSGDLGLTVTTGQKLLGGAIQGKALLLDNEVTTFAGSGNWDSLYDDDFIDPANDPKGITTDGKNLYVTDTINNIIRKVVIATGDITNIAGAGFGTSGYINGIGNSALFDGPNGITTDGTNLYIADTYNNVIRKINIETKAVTTLVGSGVGGIEDGFGTAAKLYNPFDITTDGENLYFTDPNNNVVRKVVIATSQVLTIAGAPSPPACIDGIGSAARFSGPRGITTDGINLYVTEKSCIRKIDISSREVTTLAGGTTTGYLNGIGDAARFNYPQRITTDGINLYLSDEYNNMIRKILISTKEVTTIAGSTTAGLVNGSGLEARFRTPNGITTDGTKIFICDGGNNHLIRLLE